MLMASYWILMTGENDLAGLISQCTLNNKCDVKSLKIKCIKKNCLV